MATLQPHSYTRNDGSGVGLESSQAECRRFEPVHPLSSEPRRIPSLPDTPDPPASHGTRPVTVRKQVGRSKLRDQKPKRARSSRFILPNAIDDQLGWMSHAEHRVLGCLWRHARTTGRAWPGQSLIATSSGISRGHVSRLLSTLELRGMIEVVRRGHTQSRKATEYRIRPPSSWPAEKPPNECVWAHS